MSNEILELLNSLSDNIRNMLLETNDDGKTTFNGANLSNALSVANLDEVKIILKVFLRLLCEPKGQWQKIDYSRLEPIEDRLIKLFDEIGIKESENPYIEFIAKAVGDNGINLDDNAIIDLINLYAKDEISYEDLAVKGNYGENHIIFNKNLYDVEDIYKVVQIWKWLSNYQNLRKMNWEEVLDADLSNAINRAASQMLQMGDQIGEDEASYYRDAIIFSNGTPNSKINSINTLEEVLRRGAINSSIDKKSIQTNIRNNNINRDLSTLIGKYNNLSDKELVDAIRDVLHGYNIDL